MQPYTTKIVLDISGNSQAEVVAKQDDNNSRRIAASFIDETMATFSLSNATSAECRILRPDGKMVTEEVVLDYGNNLALITLSRHALGVAGRGYGDVRLLGTNDSCLSATRFILTILPSAVSNDQLSGESVFENYLREVTELKNSLNGLSFMKISQSDYDALESPDENTVYYAVDDNGKITQYLGAAKLSSGSGGVPAESAILADDVPDTTFGIAEIEEV